LIFVNECVNLITEVEKYMQRLIAIFVIAIALTPNTGNGAELGLGELKPNSDKYTQNFDGSYSDEPQITRERKLSRNAEKMMTYMARASGEYKGFKMEFSHEVAVPAAKKFRLRMTNDEMPHWEVNGGTRGVMLNYKYEW